MSTNKIRVVVADDSALMRKKISDILSSDKDIEVVAAARNGREVIAAVYHFKPDVVTLDVEMPDINGIEALGYIMSEIPTPCIMISAFTMPGSTETLQALEFGAIDFVLKPSGVISQDIEKMTSEIISKVKIAANVQVKRLKLVYATKPIIDIDADRRSAEIKKVFAIASSTGGTHALATILPKLKYELPAAMLITQHMPVGFTKGLADRLNWQSQIEVMEADVGVEVKAGRAIIAKGGMHMEIDSQGGRAIVRLSDAPSRFGVRPCADIMMESIAKIYKEKVVGIVLTGMGSDGTEGAKIIRDHGGYVIAESEQSAVIYGMPKSVIEKGYADEIVELEDVADRMSILALG